MEIGFKPVWFLTDDHPAEERLLRWRAMFGQVIAPCEIEPADDIPFRAQLVACRLCDLGLMTCIASAARAHRRAAPCDADGLLLIRPVTGPVAIADGRRQIVVEAGQAVLVGDRSPIVCDLSRAGRVDYLKLPAGLLRATLGDLDAILFRPVARETAALDLLVHYGGALLRGLMPLAAPELVRLSAVHLQDLVALVFGGGARPEPGGVRGVRLQTIKAAIEADLTRADLSTELVARRQGVTPRYVQKLFEEEGTTFSAFVLERRLERAWRLLHHPGIRGRTISSIAFDVGFGDLSYFNRTFRRRYGASPSQLRSAVDAAPGSLAPRRR